MVLNNEEFTKLAYDKGYIVKSLKDAIETINEIHYKEKEIEIWYWVITEETPTKIVIEIRKI